MGPLLGSKMLKSQWSPLWFQSGRILRVPPWDQKCSNPKGPPLGSKVVESQGSPLGIINVHIPRVPPCVQKWSDPKGPPLGSEMFKRSEERRVGKEGRPRWCAG